MEKHKSYFTNPLLIALLGGVMAVAVACGGDDDDSTGPTAGSSGKGNSAAGQGEGGGSSLTTEPMGGMGATGNTGGTMTSMGGMMTGEGGMVAAGGMPGGCTDDSDMGCYKCAPMTHEQFLNACPTTGCEPFDNSQLTSIDKDGNLPDLP